jgi:hypothetical protein
MRAVSRHWHRAKAPGKVWRSGQPKAARAVENTLVLNPIPIMILCGGIVRSNGTFSGFVFGSEGKRKLLRSEKRGAISVTSHKSSASI